MNPPWLSIVGIGEDGLPGLSQQARLLIDQAELLIGGKRHLAMLPAGQCERRVERRSWPSPLSGLLDEIIQRRGQRICILASGDPMHYGIGATLLKRIPIEEMLIIPAPSAFSLACARLGWDYSEVETLSLHGRPLAVLNAYLQPGAKLLLLSSDRKTPAAVVELLKQNAYRSSRVVILEHMGGERERIIETSAADWSEDIQLADLNTIAVDCRADAGAQLQARIPGLADDAFQHDGQLTKREVRSITLARLMPVRGQLLWDVGAGAGSIAIEWMRSARGARAIAIEQDAQRTRMIIANAQALGVPDLQIIQDEAPAALAELAAPDAIFIGGGCSAPGMLETCWSALKSGGRLVANTVTIEGEAALLKWYQRFGGELIRLAITKVAALGAYQGWRPAMPVTQYAVIKP